MPALERRISLRGARFWIDGGELMFCNQIDGSTRDGPRPATSADRDAFPEAYNAAAAGVEHDGLGKPMLSAVDPEIIPPPAPKPYAERRNRAEQ